MGCFSSAYIMGPGERLFEQAASIQAVVGPFTVRPDGVKDDREATQYIAQVMGIVRMVETTTTGNALITMIRDARRPVLIFPLEQIDETQAYAWTSPRLGLFAVAISFTPLFGQRLRKFLGDDESKFERVFIPQEVLVHELVHAARAVTCNYARLADDDEEELAVMIANMFSVEINRPPVTNYDEMENVTSDISGFARRYYKENFEMIDAFYQQNRTLAQQLSYSKSAFNPLRLYMDENV
jgi:hypothetical protein